MFSILRKGLVYKDISPEIVDHDQDIDSDLWEYDGKDVYRGVQDPKYSKYDLNVYWLYDEKLNKVGLAEHESDEPQIYAVLWIYDNPFATLFQDESWKSKKVTLWSMLSNEAYQDCLEDDFETIFDRCLSSKYRIVTPSILIEKPVVYCCNTCGKKSMKKPKNCTNVSTEPYLQFKNLLFVDEYFVIHQQLTEQLHVSSEEQQELKQESADPQELKDAESPQLVPQSPVESPHSAEAPPPHP